ncbi:hypothetical protein [Lysinibacillus fusiformis]|uniref:hypothetical protein n=1 Tax=Lysinibacillus fusiformis TaxID=28031 RepID=UPI00088192B9|nr:hypothetical protein [Lysinibacillus fusiformis]SCX38453.1 hypothetical protein SAMN02787108_00295 [Lysinibacillus fusiformis]SDB05516.1 hypothetical protein SAMN02787070_00283 [Lysinibacillus fusiformis]SFH75378.1 hypothetical protein SAMN02787080_00282 [Lysinibacillus fusiformis]SFT29770.1 hypothetical protein SAMN02787099_04565 [Lysinibacillus fusiformis]
MLVEYYTFKNGEERHTVEIDIEEGIYGDNLEEIQIINKKISEAVNLPIGTFKFRRVL